MNELQVEQVEEAIRISKIGIDQAKKSLKIKDEVEQGETLREAWSNLTNAGALMWRARFNEGSR